MLWINIMNIQVETRLSGISRAEYEFFYTLGNFKSKNILKSFRGFKY